MAETKDKKPNKKPFRQKDKDGKKFNKNHAKKPDKKPENGEKKPENKGDFKCNNCGGNLVRRWIFSDGKSCTLLQCENCGTTTKPRDIRYQENGYVWGTKIRKSKPEKKAS